MYILSVYAYIALMMLIIMFIILIILIIIIILLIIIIMILIIPCNLSAFAAALVPGAGRPSQRRSSCIGSSGGG